jgi:hypothetical protein
MSKGCVADFWLAFGLLFTIGEHWSQVGACVVLAVIRMRQDILERPVEHGDLKP